MKRTLTITLVSALAMGALASGTAAKPHSSPSVAKLAAKLCKSERQALGKTGFAAKYGRHARRTCLRRARGEAKAIVRNAAQECRDERDQLGLDAFRDKYGKNHNKRNAFGKCVSSLARGGNNGGRGDDAGDGNGGEDGDGEGDDDQPGLDDAPGLDDDPPGLDGDPGLDDGQPDEGEGDV